MTSTAPALVPDPLASVSVRDQIIEAADEYFSRFGYAKTTVSDLAKAIGFSKAYIYKFFDSKQAIGEAICTRCLTGQLLAVEAAVEAADGPNERLRAFFREILKQSLEQFFNDRQLYDIVSHSCAEQWGSLASSHRSRNQFPKPCAENGCRYAVSKYVSTPHGLAAMISARIGRTGL